MSSVLHDVLHTRYVHRYICCMQWMYLHIPLQMHLQGVSTLLWTTNAKLVGCVYLCASICYGISGLLLSWVMRGELAGLGEQLLFGDHQLYNTLTTSGVVLCIHDGVL